MTKRYWSTQELVEYLKQLSYEFGRDAHRNNDLLAKGKSEAYEQAAFEIEHNLRKVN